MLKYYLNCRMLFTFEDFLRNFRTALTLKPTHCSMTSYRLQLNQARNPGTDSNRPWKIANYV